MRKLALAMIVIAALALAACGSGTQGGYSPAATTAPTDTAAASAPTATQASGGGTGAATIAMSGSAFTSGKATTIKAGQAVTFSDPGGVHHLVTGTEGSFSAEAGAPTEFATDSGIDFSPGDTKTVTFPTAGTYHITCTIHPSMNATITVTP